MASLVAEVAIEKIAKMDDTDFFFLIKKLAPRISDPQLRYLIDCVLEESRRRWSPAGGK